LAALCGLAAAVFFVAYARNRQEWWRLLPAWTLTSLATMALTVTMAHVDRSLIAAQVCAGLALAFGHIYLTARAERWWAILPGGFMLVLAAVVGASSYVAATEVLAALLFIGLGLVFFLLYLLDSKRRQWWALIPGIVLVLFGVLALSAERVQQEGGLVRWWPLVLVAAGLLLGVQARRAPSRPDDKLVISSAPRARGSAADKKGVPPPGAARPASRSALGDYSQPAPGASVEILPDND
jgi:hypothetical protein